MSHLTGASVRSRSVVFQSVSFVGTTLIAVLLGSSPAVSSPAPTAIRAYTQPEDGTVSLTISSPNSLTAESLVCDVSIDDPHYTPRATPTGVIAKLRYSCVGNMQGELKVDLNLYRYAPGTVGPYAPKANNYETPVVYGGSVGTIYVPAERLGGIYCNKTHWYYAYANVTLVAGLQRDSGDARSNTVHPASCS